MTVRSERDESTVDETRRRGGGPGSVVAWIVGIIAAIALVYLVLYLFGAFDDDADSELGETDDVEIADLGISANDVIEEPDQYIGQVVTVSGTVEEIVGPRSFTINAGDLPGESLLVVGTEAIDIPAGVDRDETESDNTVVQVTGTVYTFDDNMLDDTGDVYGFMYEEDAFNPYIGEPVILVDDVEFSGTTPP